MGRKTISKIPFTSPSGEEVTKLVKSVGGKAPASRIVKKDWSTVDRWCRGTVKVDFANWKLLHEYKIN